MIDFESFKQGASILADRLRLGWDEAGCYDSARLMAFFIPFIPYMPEELQRTCTSVTSNMLVCQERRDWLGLADYLDVEVIELLEAVEVLMDEQEGGASGVNDSGAFQ